jgi:hypothetical protein
VGCSFDATYVLVSSEARRNGGSVRLRECVYRNIGFPSTQDVEEINMQAEQQRESKRAEMQREAEKKDGKYRRVAK